MQGQLGGAFHQGGQVGAEAVGQGFPFDGLVRQAAGRAAARVSASNCMPARMAAVSKGMAHQG